MPTVAVKPLPPAPAPAKVLTADAAQGHLVAQFDQDHDGRVSLREMLQQSVKQQMAADTNHDGVLSSDEFHHGMGDAALKDPYITELFKSIDKNGDGRLDEQEIASHAWPGIAALDRNRDGFIDAADTLGAAPAQANHAASQKGQ